MISVSPNMITEDRREKMSERFIRTQMLLGEKAMTKLKKARVAVFGVGGVGGYVCEALVRSGIGNFLLVDRDTVSISNLNRQIIALTSTVGRYKTEVMRERMLDINPEVNVEIRNCFFLPENADEFDFAEFDYVVDAVDTVTAKIEIILRSSALDVPVISSMGAGNKLDAGRLKVADIYDTQVCPLARVMRRELKKRGIKKLKCVYSDEPPIINDAKKGTAGVLGGDADPSGESELSADPPKKVAPGSVAFVPAAAGLMLAGEIVRDIACF